MISIQSINQNQVTFNCQELNSTVIKNLSDLEHHDLFLNVTIEPYTQSIYLYNTDGQHLWQAYMNNVMSLSSVQAEATSRSIDTTGKTQDQLARSIIQHECTTRGFSYLLDVEGLSVPTMSSMSVDPTRKTASKTIAKKKKK